ncbi:MAG: phosphodiesterase [Tepidimonas sp.]|uniref:phosphodiesterase n=1 Tax=Tepidimonas sp. TaxID=2002775 RepID=UPI00259E7327|nr:phosphodiesterase [Tepidimonas sp.]MDM7456462.1 phosphodiesterase [Tepidimonas sp.]
MNAVNMFILPLPSASASPDPHSVRGLLQTDSLRMHLQPIVDMAACRIIGHEALVRTPAECTWRTPDTLFAAARREGSVLELEQACMMAALVRRREVPGPGQLFVNLSAAAFVRVLSLMANHVDTALNLDWSGVVIELTEHEHVHDVSAAQEALTFWRGRGGALALDDFGDGRSSLRLWSELRPEYIKIDKYFIHHIHREGHKIKTLRALQQLAETFGSRLIAEGVEEADELMALRDLNIPLVQGYFLGRPDLQPATEIPQAAMDVLQSRQLAVLPEDRPVINRGLTARSLMTIAEALPSTANHKQALDFFAKHPDLHAVALLEEGKPLGLLARHTMEELAIQQPYFRELYGKRPCIRHANTSPLIVDANTPIEQLTSVLVSADQRYLREGFIITEGGRYIGLGTGEQLVRRVTEARIEAARHANPLTFLPGNVPLTLHMERLLENREPFTACYADLNNFKAFNDHYGYWRGDEMIRLQARCLSEACDPRKDFIGHVGGDDFVLLMQSEDWHERVTNAVEKFNTLAQELFDENARKAGGIYAEDRHGIMRFHPMTTVSIGAVRVQPKKFAHAEQVANAAAMAKHHAKQSRLGIYVDDEANPG